MLQARWTMGSIKLSGDYEKFYEWKEKTKEISRHKGIIKYLTKEVKIPTEEETEKNEGNMNEI